MSSSCCRQRRRPLRRDFDGKGPGVLVLTSDAAVDCKDAINVSRNSFVTMRSAAEALAKAMGGKGSVLIVSGVPGTKGESVLQSAIDTALAGYPDIKVVGKVAGNWTPSVAQSAVATFLSTNPRDIDGIIEMGEMGVAAENAFKQSGRKPVLVTAASGECAAFAYWKANPELPRWPRSIHRRRPRTRPSTSPIDARRSEAGAQHTTLSDPAGDKGELRPILPAVDDRLEPLLPRSPDGVPCPTATSTPCSRAASPSARARCRRS